MRRSRACQGDKARSEKGIPNESFARRPRPRRRHDEPGARRHAWRASANADTPVGTCTNSYSPNTYEQLAFDPDAQAIFSVIDANGDGVICFKPYPNGDHNGHLGNLVDDKAAPHA
jgi:hypothetical protein